MAPSPIRPRVRPSSWVRSPRGHWPARTSRSMAGMRRVTSSMRAMVCSARACALTPGVLVTVTPRALHAGRSTLSVPAPQIEMRRSLGQAASTRSLKRAWARMFTTTSASPMRSMRVASWSAPRSVNTRTWPIFLSGASATEPVRAGGKSSGTTIFTASLGIGLVLVGVAGEADILAEPGGVEQREIHRGPAVHDPLGDHAAGHRGVLEAVSAESHGEEEPLYAGGGADDGVIVGGEWPQTRPAAGDLRPLEQGEAMDGLGHGLVELAPVHGHVLVLADILHVARAQQHLLHLLAEIETTGLVVGQGHGSRQLGERLGEEDVTAARENGHGNAGKPTHPRRGRAGGVDDERGRDVALCRPHAAHAAVRHVDGHDLDAFHDTGAQLPGARGEALRHLGRAGQAVLRPPHGGDEIVYAEGGHEGLGVLGGDYAYVHAEAPLHRDALLEAAEVLLLGDEEEVADLLEAGIDAEVLGEVLEHLEALQGEADLRLGRKLRADAARRLARGPAAHRLALEDDHVSLPATGEVIGDAAAHHATPDDDDTRGSGLGHDQMTLATRVPSRSASWMRRGETASPIIRSSGTLPASRWKRLSLALPPKARTTVSASSTVSTPEKVCRVRRPAGSISTAWVMGWITTPWVKRRW